MNSISFLANDSLTFPRFSGGVTVPTTSGDHPDSRRDPRDEMRGRATVNLAKSAETVATDTNNSPPKMSKRQQKKASKKAMLEEDINFSTAVWTTANMNKLLGNNETANIEFQYLTPSTTTATTPTNNSTSSSADGNNTLRHLQRVQSQNNKNVLANNSTIKLLSDDDDEDKPCKQVSVDT